MDRPQSRPISEADARSLTTGVSEIFRLSVFENGNSKIQALHSEIEEAISTPGVELYPMLISTSDRPIPEGAGRLLKDAFEQSMGDSDAFEYRPLSDLYQIISPYGGGGGVRFNLVLHGYNKVSMPFDGYYGWITGSTLADLYGENGVKLFAKNLRSGLGETEINDEILQTAQHSPEDFWYFNNGVTFTSEGVSRTLRGGAAADSVELAILNGSIVNGAQTTSTLASLLEKPDGEEALSRIKCLVRVLEIPKEQHEFASNVTRFNNSQNGIGVKDFVSLDSFQQELRRGLDKEFAVNYVIRSGEETSDAQVPSISLQEATLALVSCGTTIENAVRAKDKISSLWRDTGGAPYTTIFDRSRVTPLSLYKAVEANREIERFLRNKINAARGVESSDVRHGERAVATHGNRLFAFYVLSGANIYREEVRLDEFRAKLGDLDLEASFEEFSSVVLGDVKASKQHGARRRAVERMPRWA
ncbi:AIPR family protein [Brachybacterium paraconglomeratum]|uniref:AIPR family protein n=1 Tax=Brachybacterium paraconglomeratum TaxID=173362 RepID=UPI0037C611AE